MSREAGKMLDMAEAVEFLLAEYLARRPLDEALLAKCPARDNSEWLATVAAREEECGELQLVVREKPHWKNPLARIAAAHPAAPTICTWKPTTLYSIVM